MNKKAQLTLEMLIILAISISFILVAIYSVDKMQNAQKELFAHHRAKSILKSINEQASEICVLGEGNSRTVSLSKNLRIELTSNEIKKTVSIKSLNFNYTLRTICTIRVIDNNEFKNMAYLWYEKEQGANEPVIILSTQSRKAN